MDELGIPSANRLGALSGVAPNTVSNFLNPDKREPSASGKQSSGKLAELEMLCHALGTDVPGLLSHENVDKQAQRLSHRAVEDTPTAAEVGGRQPPVSFDAEFAKMRPSEQRRFLFLWAAAFDEPPDPTDHLGGIPQWNPSTSAPGASPGRTTPAKKAPAKERHRRLG